MSARFVGLCSCGRQYHAATEVTLRRNIKEALESGHDVTVWAFSYGLAGSKPSSASAGKLSTEKNDQS